MARFTYAHEGREKIRKDAVRSALLEADEAIYGETVAADEAAIATPRCCSRPMVNVGTIYGSAAFECATCCNVVGTH